MPYFCAKTLYYIQMKTIIFFLVVSNHVFAQSLVSQVIDAHSLEPIPYASLFCSKKQIGTYTDSTGFFVLSPIQKLDSIKISSVGYISIIQTVEKLEGKQVRLQKDNTYLKEITVWSKKIRRTKNFGYFKPYIGFQSLRYNVNSHAIMAVFIENTKEKEGIIQEVSYKFGAAKNSIAKSFRLRVRIFSDKSAKPNSDLLTDSVIFDVKPTDNIKKIDLIHKNILFPSNGIWIGIETLGYITFKDEYVAIRTGTYGKGSDKNIAPYVKCFRTNSKKIQGMVYQYGKWQKFDSSQKYTIPLFSIKIIY